MSDRVILTGGEHGVGFHIQELWAWISVHDDGDEGLIGSLHGGTWLPLIGADRERIESLRSWAVLAAAASGKPVVLARFSVRTDIETIQP